MKSRAMLSADVVETDAFLSLSLESQVAYVHLAFAADVTGRIRGASRVIRGYGLEQDTLIELLDFGYLLDVDGEIYDAYAWVNNKFDARLAKQMDNCQPYQTGKLLFTGEACKSAYTTIGATTERRNSDVSTTPNSNINSNGNNNDNDNAKACQSQSQTQSQRVAGASIEAQDYGTEDKELHPCMCPTCKETEARYWQDNEGTHIICPTCGTFAYDNHR